MVPPPVHLPDSVLEAEERVADTASVVSAGGSVASPEPRPSDDEASSPVCAACWAY